MEARNCRSDRRETGTQIGQIGEIEKRIGYQIRKLHRISNPKTASDIKSENCIGYQIRKPAGIFRENRKPDAESRYSRKPQ